jgi:hypothetical protein
VARGDDVHVGPDHHQIADRDAAHVVDRAAPVDEDLAPDTDRAAAAGIERRNEVEAFIHLLAGQHKLGAAQCLLRFIVLQVG